MDAETIANALGGRKAGNGWTARCPAHDDKDPSLSIGTGTDGRVLLHCHAGCDVREVIKAVGLEYPDLFPKGANGSAHIPPINRAYVHTQDRETRNGGRPAIPNAGITVADYAVAKVLPTEFLSELGLVDRKHNGKCRISMPYLDQGGRQVAIRYRIAIWGDRFRWRGGSKPQLYGLWRLDDARKAGLVVIVEGESDCHTAWFHDVPAVGVPGASNWCEERDARHLDGIEKIYILIEPDAGGEAVRKWLSTSTISDRVCLIDLGQYKDLSELHVAESNQFEEIWQDAMANAMPYRQIEEQQAKAKYQEALAACGDLIEQPDILALFADALSKAGLVGETKTAKLIYLALTSRFFSRPISVVVKGPSSAGKSYTLDSVLAFFPQDAYYSLTAMSDRALAYSDEPLEHRFIVIFEAVGLESDFATYLMRSLLSEGCVRYETVEKTSEGIKPRLIERKGPTGCLLTTTEARLHPENETRMLSVTVSDSREQTRGILDRLAAEAKVDINLDPWQSLQTWLSGANHDVTIPYAEALASLVPDIAVRLRRDFHHVLTLIKAHAVLHQASRDESEDGRIIATLIDYAAIHDLIAETIAEGVEATVRPEVRQTVEAVKSLTNTRPEGVTVKQVSDQLKLDASTTSRRVSVARSHGYIKNEEQRRRMPAKLVIGDKMPDEVEILPHPDRLRDSVQVCTIDQGDNQTHKFGEEIVEIEI